MWRLQTQRALDHISVTLFKIETANSLGAGEGEEVNELKQSGECMDY
jgi:hypothetical protein